MATMGIEEGMISRYIGQLHLRGGSTMEGEVRLFGAGSGSGGYRESMGTLEVERSHNKLSTST